MKKNFVKKLALGLALVMAVTSVPVSSEAAAKKPFFKNASVEVKEGETVKAVIKKTKGYTIKKLAAKDETVAKTTHDQKKKKIVVMVEGVKAGETTVVAKLKKGTAKAVKANLAVTVKAEEKAAMTVEATGVKEITVTFSKEMDKDSKITVKKGTASPNFTPAWATDGKSVVLTMGSKLQDATYDVTVGDLTGSVTTKEEKVTSIEIGANLIETVAASTTTGATAYVNYKVLNQYGERMSPAGDVIFGTSFSANATDAGTECTEKATGKVVISDIPYVLALPEKTGTITATDMGSGVTTTATVTYSAAATPTTATIEGTFEVNDEKLESLVAGSKVADYAVLVQVKDQYDNALTVEDITAMQTAVYVYGGITNIDGFTLRNYEYNNEDYILIELQSDKVVAKAGTFNVMIIGKLTGTIANATITVEDGVVIKSVNVYANDSVYAEQKNVLSYEVYDTNGNEVTNYKVLNALVKFTQSTGDNNLTWYENADGTAQLRYEPAAVTINVNKMKDSEIRYFMATLNEGTVNQGSKNFSIKVNETRVPVQVVGLASGTPTAAAAASDVLSAGAIELAIADVLVEDQYANVYTTAEAGLLDDEITVSVVGTAFTGAGKIPYNYGAGYVEIAAATTAEAKEEAVLLLSVTGQAKPYEVKLTVVDSMKASNLEISHINKDYVVKNEAVVSTLSAISFAKGYEVTGTVAGKTVVIPTGQYKITNDTATKIQPLEGKVTKTAKLEVTVDTEDGPVVLTKEYSYSTEDSKLVALYSNPAVSAVSNNNFAAAFGMKDQYGDNYTGSAVKYTVKLFANANENAKVVNNGTQAVSVTGYTAGVDKAYVTATCGDITVTKEVTLN